MISLSNIQNRDIVIFGTGLDAVKCAYSFYNRKIVVKYFLNNNRQIDTFLGCPVYDLCDKEVLNGEYVIVAVDTMSTYLILVDQLNKLYLEEFTDYIYYKWIDKKLVLLHGNCHMEIIKAYLESSEKFLTQYAIYPNPMIQDNKKKKIHSIVLENCELWIHEDIKADNACGYFLSDEYIREAWKKNINNKEKKEIVVPHLFGMGKAFFPQSELCKRTRKMSNAQDINGMFPHTDLIIDKCVAEGMSIEDIVLYCKSDLALESDYIVENFKKYMEKIKEREKSWDIKIHDFILINYQREKLFYDEGHPTNIIMKKICQDILNILEIEEDCIHTNECMDTHENPVYPVVKHTLELKWDEGEIRKSHYAKKMGSKMGIEEYIREYIWWNYYCDATF